MAQSPATRLLWSPSMVAPSQTPDSMNTQAPPPVPPLRSRVGHPVNLRLLALRLVLDSVLTRVPEVACCSPQAISSRSKPSVAHGTSPYTAARESTYRPHP